MAGSDNVAATDPWSDDKLCTPEDHWNLEKDGCPLVYISELLLNWPDSTPTVDLDIEEKIERFVGIILGYPKISRGMYPLDWPTHPESIKALRLSLLLDSMTCKKYPEWSLRTSISIIHQIYCLDGKTEKHRKYVCNLVTGLLFKAVRRFKSSDQDLTGKNLTKQEIILLSRLHSSTNYTSFFWDFAAKKNQKIVNPNGDEYNLDKMKLRVSDFADENIHDFRITKIHDWINKMTMIDYIGNYPLKDNVRQNMITGCSVIIDSVFATLRNTIVTKYGPSSIFVDGGGRIRFYAKDAPNIEEELTKIIYNTFMISEGKTHPFNNIIVECVKLYQNRFTKYKIKEYVNKDGNPSRKLFHDLIGEEQTKRLLPPISYNGNNNTQLPENPFESNCYLCNPKDWDDDEKWDSYKEWGNHCFAHKLIYDIGQSAKKRDISWRKSGKYEELEVGKMFQIEAITVLDLNSLGVMFQNKSETFEDRLLKIRRSFRFNAQWWKIISKVLDHPELNFGSLTAWVAAGDDLTLALRKGNQNYDLIMVLQEIDKNLKSEFINNKISFSFGAGITKKRNGESILSLIKQAQKAEKNAKMHWKFRAFEHDKALITESDGKIKEGLKEIYGCIVLNDSYFPGINEAHKSIVYNLEGEEE